MTKLIGAAFAALCALLFAPAAGATTRADAPITVVQDAPVIMAAYHRPRWHPRQRRRYRG